jgi:hypothetical protein
MGFMKQMGAKGMIPGGNSPQNIPQGLKPTLILGDLRRG